MSHDPPARAIDPVVLGRWRVGRLLDDDGAALAYALDESGTGAGAGAGSTGVLYVLAGVPARGMPLGDVAARAARHAVGIAALVAPVDAGPVALRTHGGEADPRAGVVAPIPAGRSAREIVAEAATRGTRWSVDDVVAAIEAPAAALGALHDQGIVHGRVGPGALYVAAGPSGAAPSGSLGAYGIAQVAEALGGPVAVRDAAPPAYRAPEQCGPLPWPLGPWSDVYGLAIVAAELLAGRAWTEPADAADLERSIRDPARRPTPRALGASVTDAVEALFARALAVEPSGRPADPRAFVRDLARAAAEPAPAATVEGDPRAAAPDADGGPAPPDEPATVPRQVPAPAPVAPPARLAPPAPAPPRARPTPLWVPIALAAGFVLLGGGVVGALAWSLFRPDPGGASGSGSTGTATVAATETPDPTPVPTPTATATSTPPSTATSTPTPLSTSTTVLPPPSTAARAADAAALIPIAAATPTIGARDALVTIVEFADLDCPYTARVAQVLDRLLARHAADLRLAFKHYPLPQHPRASGAAEAASAVWETGGPEPFARFVQRVLLHQPVPDDDGLVRWASDAGAPEAKIRAALGRHAHAARVAADRQLGGQLGVRGTPTLFVNGRRVEGAVGEAELGAIVEDEIAAARAAIASGVARDRLYARRVLANVTTAEGER